MMNMKKHDIVIALVGVCVALLLVLSSCTLPGTGEINGGSAGRGDTVNDSAVLDNAAIDKFLTNEGKDTSNVPRAPSLKP